MLLDAQQAGRDNGSETITDRSMHKPASPSDGITCVAVDAHAGVWLALLLVTSIAGWVIGDLLHTAGLWLIDCLAMPFGVFQPMAARFSSLMGFTMEATSVAVSSLPNVDGLSATTAFSTGMTTSADSISTAVSFVWSMAGHVFRTALSWLFAIVVSIPKAFWSAYTKWLSCWSLASLQPYCCSQTGCHVAACRLLQHGIPRHDCSLLRELGPQHWLWGFAGLTAKSF